MTPPTAETIAEPTHAPVSAWHYWHMLLWREVAAALVSPRLSPVRRDHIPSLMLLGAKEKTLARVLSRLSPETRARFRAAFPDGGPFGLCFACAATAGVRDCRACPVAWGEAVRDSGPGDCGNGVCDASSDSPYRALRQLAREIDAVPRRRRDRAEAAARRRRCRDLALEIANLPWDAGREQAPCPLPWPVPEAANEKETNP